MKDNYVAYWLSKGEYGKERLRRALVRKQKRRDKYRYSCKCGRNKKTPYLHSCPYSEDMHGDYTEHCTCCGECQHNCAMDI